MKEKPYLKVIFGRYARIFDAFNRNVVKIGLFRNLLVRFIADNKVKRIFKRIFSKRLVGDVLKKRNVKLDE